MVGVVKFSRSIWTTLPKNEGTLKKAVGTTAQREAALMHPGKFQNGGHEVALPALECQASELSGPVAVYACIKNQRLRSL